MKQLHRRLLLRSIACICTIPVAISSLAQTSTTGTTPNQPSTTTEPQKDTTEPHGEVLYQSHGEPGSPQPESTASTPSSTPPSTAAPQLTDADRAAIRITDYDLDIRITPRTSTINGRARITLTNTSDTPLPRIALQISSTLTWQSATLQRTGQPLPLAQHHLDTDADHTGKSSEVILTLPTPLAPAATLTIDTFYTGTIQQSGGRLERLGAAPDQALATDWDAITADSTALRGFGNVLWYPVAAPQLFLSDGSLVPAVGKARLADAATNVHLRLSMEYTGEAPVAVYFCGRRQALAALPDNSDAPVASGSGIATANFPAEPIGFRALSLFVIGHAETMVAPLPAPQVSSPKTAAKAPAFSSSSATAQAPQALTGDTPVLAVETNDDSVLAPLTDSAERIAPLLEDWLGPHPLSALTLIDYPGQPFEDGPLLVAPLAALAAPTAAPLLAHSLTHAWVQTGQSWMDEGLAEFFSLLWTEREKGRDAAVAQLDGLLQPVIAADSAPDTQTEAAAAPVSSTSSSSSNQASEASAPGQPLIDASDEIFYRRKAAAVWWMLRDIAGEQPLQLALSAWRTQPVRHDDAESQARAFEALLEKTSGKDLGWFFNDWVLRDRGLPNLSIVDVTPRLLPAGTGHDSGWLVAVTMHNQGEAAAEVPLTIRSGAFSVTKRIRIPGLSSVTYREVVETAPTEVVLNDGSVPETGAMEHTRTVVIHNE